MAGRVYSTRFLSERFIVKNYLSMVLLLPYLAFSAMCGDLSKFYPAQTVVEHGRYALSFDAARRCPRWVCWRIEGVAKAADRKGMVFHADPAVYRSPSKTDYDSSGFDIGHMCPAGDMTSDSVSLKDTFSTANACPQLAALNRGDWKELEAALHSEACTKPVWCVCGPIWLTGRSALIGDGGTAVPDSFFKIAYGGTCTVSRAWVFPNKAGNRPLGEYSVPVMAVESQTGLTFVRPHSP